MRSATTSRLFIGASAKLLRQVFTLGILYFILSVLRCVFRCGFAVCIRTGHTQTDFGPSRQISIAEKGEEKETVLRNKQEIEAGIQT